MGHLQRQTNDAFDQRPYLLTVSIPWFSRMVARLCATVVLTAMGCGRAPIPENPLIVQAREQLKNRDFDSAIASVDSLLKTEPNDYTARLLRGESNLKAKKFDEAIEDFTLAAKLEPGNPDAFNFRYLAYFEKSKQYEVGSDKWIKFSESASADLKRYHQLDPTSIEARKASTPTNSRIDELISKPIPGMEPQELDQLDADQFAADSPADQSSPLARSQETMQGQLQSENPFEALMKPRKGLGDGEEASADDAGQTDQLAIDQQAERAAEQKIQEQDLALQETKDPEDPIPHGDEGEPETNAPVPPPQITRNNIDAFLPQNAPGLGFENPNPSQQFSTGIVPTPSSPITAGPTGFNTGQYSTGISSPAASGIPSSGLSTRTTGFNSNQAAAATPTGPAPPWSGIGSTVTTGLGTQSNVPQQTGFGGSPGIGARAGFPFQPRPGAAGGPGTAGAPSTISTALPTGNGDPFSGPTGFLSQEARSGLGSPFGPRLGPQQRPGDESEDDDTEKKRLPTRSDRLKPLTTALPVVGEIRYGALVPENPWGSPTAIQPPLQSTRQSNLGPAPLYQQ